MTVLLAGTSGTGKSTLASLLAARLGVTTILSTDSIRHMMRGFTSEAASPLLWASTYSVRPSDARFMTHLHRCSCHSPASQASKGTTSGVLQSAAKVQGQSWIEPHDLLQAA